MKHEITISIHNSDRTDTQVVCVMGALLKNTSLGDVATIRCRTEGVSEWFPPDDEEPEK